MKREDIIKAAKEYAMDNIPLDSTTKREIMIESFLAGVKWFADNLWHPKIEQPIFGKLLLIDVYGYYDLCCAEDKKFEMAKRWAYIKDLITNMEE